MTDYADLVSQARRYADKKDATRMGVAAIGTELLRLQADAIEALVEERDDEIERRQAVGLSLEAAEAERGVYEAALRFISDESIPDQPASSSLSGLEWAVNSYRELRKVAWDVIDGKFHTYQAPRSEPEIKVRGVGRDLFEPRSASVALTERPTNEELISLHEYLRGWKP
jgi:hypothetical protein